jgi:hypothetical protein
MSERGGRGGREGEGEGGRGGEREGGRGRGREGDLSVGKGERQDADECTRYPQEDLREGAGFKVQGRMFKVPPIAPERGREEGSGLRVQGS